jgi:Zn-finger nucleic acid-binding protein
MGFLRRLFGRGEPELSIHTESTPTQIRMSVSGAVPKEKRPRAPRAAAPLPPSGDFVAPVLPNRPQKEFAPKNERPYRSTTCPCCNVELSTLPKGKKACPSCRAVILVRTGQDGFMYLIREPDLAIWTEWNDKARVADFEREEAEERAALKAAGFLVSQSGWSVQVVGESHYQSALEKIAGGRSEHGADKYCIARLVREPTNRYDANAVRVEVSGQTVGYVSRDDAEDVQELLQKLDGEGRPAWIRATIVGGWQREDSRGSFGIELDDLPDIDEL